MRPVGVIIAVETSILREPVSHFDDHSPDEVLRFLG